MASDAMHKDRDYWREMAQCWIRKCVSLKAENVDLREELAALRRQGDSCCPGCCCALIPTCGHCGQFVESKPIVLTEYQRDRQAYIAADGSKWPKSYVHAHNHLFDFADLPLVDYAFMGMDPATGKVHTVRVTIENGKVIATGPCCDGACARESCGSAGAPAIDPIPSSYCPACGGHGSHRIGCPNK